jgi:uncharacterized phage protein gp47/JayE
MNIPDEYDKSVGSFFYDTQAPLSAEHETMYKQLDGILEQGFAATAGGVYLERKVAEQGLTRKPATFAEGSVRISGNVGAGVSMGIKVSSDLAMYTVLQTVTIPAAGFITVSVRCDTAGAVGNVPVGAIKDFPVSISGLTAVTNTEALVGGYNAETDDELRKRYFEKVSKPATSGNRQHYMNWAKEVPGVGDVRVHPLWNGNGTVRVIIINAHKQPAEPSLIQAVTAHIENSRPVGAAVTVVTASPVNINVSATLTLEGGFTVAAVRPGITAAVNEYLRRVTFVSASVSIAHIGSAVLSVEGIRYASGGFGGGYSCLKIIFRRTTEIQRLCAIFWAR